MQDTLTYINTNETMSDQENFRLWITTEVHPKFSISLLQISIHYTYEPPEGKFLMYNIFCHVKTSWNDQKTQFK